MHKTGLLPPDAPSQQRGKAEAERKTNCSSTSEQWLSHRGRGWAGGEPRAQLCPGDWTLGAQGGFVE